MARSISKGPFCSPSLLNRVSRVLKLSLKERIKTWSRQSVVIPDLVGLTVLVHNGKLHMPIHILEEMVGHKLGEFAPTRVFHGHSKEKQPRTKERHDRLKK
ncbi:30S ribosomal protein S19 [Candidatus Tremblaya phenacola]|uniref:Small ribosomal subunit protein uS19 n=1 Tax=Candidatus Tremblayella phenacoccinincola TaxID=1010676 RepID=A0A2G0V6X2_9PROT|nr:30S ribosomal protein S19 [Candidatus Tremblaya phenacola]PHN16211.1 30S ribosomal protein S19 [Candidatus Tremblaya phenacola]